jgi:hypothetical protein
VLQRCIDEGLVGGEGFALDASLIQTDASDRNRIEGATSLPPEAAGRAVEAPPAKFHRSSSHRPTPRRGGLWTGLLRLFDHNLIDVDNAIIVDVEATTAIVRPRLWRQSA